MYWLGYGEYPITWGLELFFEAASQALSDCVTCNYPYTEY
jgi:hypothetical protein